MVGSVATPEALRTLNREAVAAACDLVEIRLDGLATGGEIPQPEAWAHLRGLPLLFTARRGDEGGSGAWSAAQREAMLRAALADAALLDVEVASIGEMPTLLRDLAARGLPWVASFHDFSGPSDAATLGAARDRAAAAGAAVFKAAVTPGGVADLCDLVAFQGAPSPLPVAVMGMGPLGPVSRLLGAQFGSPLHYGFLGPAPTAPGQWSAALLREAIRHLAPLRHG